MIHDGEGHTILYQVQQALDSYIQKVAGKINASHSVSIEEKANFERLWRATSMNTNWLGHFDKPQNNRYLATQFLFRASLHHVNLVLSYRRLTPIPI
jgi:hypothetical protein